MPRSAGECLAGRTVWPSAWVRRTSPAGRSMIMIMMRRMRSMMIMMFQVSNLNPWRVRQKCRPMNKVLPAVAHQLPPVSLMMIMTMAMMIKLRFKVSILNSAKLNNNQLWPPVVHVLLPPMWLTWVESDDVATVRLNLFLFPHQLPCHIFLPLPRAPYTPTNPNWALAWFPPWYEWHAEAGGRWSGKFFHQTRSAAVVEISGASLPLPNLQGFLIVPKICCLFTFMKDYKVSCSSFCSI